MLVGCVLFFFFKRLSQDFPSCFNIRYLGSFSPESLFLSCHECVGVCMSFHYHQKENHRWENFSQEPQVKQVGFYSQTQPLLSHTVRVYWETGAPRFFSLLFLLSVVSSSSRTTSKVLFHCCCKHLSSILLANFSYTMQCQLQSPCYTLNTQTQIKGF